jgi:hypothetical protein
MNISPRITVAMLAGLTICAGIVLSGTRRGGPITSSFQLHDTPPFRDYKQIISWWEGRQFTNVDAKNPDAAASNLHILFDASIPPSPGRNLLEAEARKSATRFIKAYSSGTFDDYLAFTAPISGFSENREIVEHWKDVLISSGVVPAPSKGEAILPASVRRVFWEKGIAREYDGIPQFTGYIQGIANEDSVIAITKEKEYPVPAVLAARTHQNRTNTGMAGYAHTFNAALSASAIGRREGFVYIMEVNMLIKPKAPDYPHPFSIWYYWDPDDNTWIPDEFIELTNYKRSFGFLF